LLALLACRLDGKVPMRRQPKFNNDLDGFAPETALAGKSGSISITFFVRMAYFGMYPRQFGIATVDLG
jgi:hypothetical protein